VDSPLRIFSKQKKIKILKSVRIKQDALSCPSDKNYEKEKT